MMGAVWENTLVVVLRDLQWINHIKNGNLTRPPNFFQVLEGNAESLTGDLIISEASRFFLLELKSDEHGISSEWGKRPSGLPKFVFSKLRALVRKMNRARAESGDALEEDKNIYFMSLRGHHFAYFSPINKPGISVGDIWIEPYIMACARKSTSETLGMPKAKRNWRLIKKWSGNEQVYTRLTYGDVVGKSAHLVKFYQKEQQIEKIGQLGLTREEMDRYLGYLADGSEEGDRLVKSALIDDEGHFFGVVESMEDLDNLRFYFKNPKLAHEISAKVRKKKI